MRWFVLLIGFSATPALAQDANILLNCVEAQPTADVSSCRRAYIEPCLVIQPDFPHVCHLAETNLWGAEIRRGVSPLLGLMEDDRFTPEERQSFYSKWLASHEAITKNEDRCADLRFVDMIDGEFSGPAYYSCIIDGHEATLMEVRAFLESVL